jgi:hypothetical protein
MKPLKQGYIVDVCVELGFYESGDLNPDRCKYDEHEFASHDQAVVAARRMLPQDKFGAVSITPFTRDKYGINYDYENKEFIE